MVGLLVLLGAAYLGARESSLFAVRTLEVAGAPAAVSEAVRSEARPLLGTSLVALDGADLERRLERLPSVRVARVDRAFPHAVRIVVRPERPVAVVRRGARAWLVSGRARVIREIESGALLRLPRVWVGGVGALTPGAILAGDEGALEVRALARVPEGFPMQVAAARVDEGNIVLVLGRDTQLRLGGAGALRVKLEAAARVLRRLAPVDRQNLDYLDVSVPDRPVALASPQLAG